MFIFVDYKKSKKYLEFFLGKADLIARHLTECIGIRIKIPYIY